MELLVYPGMPLAMLTLWLYGRHADAKGGAGYPEFFALCMLYSIVMWISLIVFIIVFIIVKVDT